MFDVGWCLINCAALSRGCWQLFYRWFLYPLYTVTVHVQYMYMYSSTGTHLVSFIHSYCIGSYTYSILAIYRAP